MNKSFDKDWETIHANQEWGKYPAETVIRFVARNYYKVPDRTSIKILDYGCGSGAHTWYLAKEGFDVYAFDGSKSAIERVYKRLATEGLSANLKVSDALELDYTDCFFDAVIDNVCSYANTFDNIKEMYKSMYHILKHGGRLFTSVFSTATSGFNTGECIEHHTYKNITDGPLSGRGTTHFYDKDEITSILISSGFTEVIVEPMEYIDNGNHISLFNVRAVKE